MPTLGRRRATRQDDCPTRCGPHPDHGNGLAGEPRLGPSVTLAPVWGVPSSQAASLWRSERNLAMRRGGGRARGGATQEPQQPQGFVPHPSRFVPPSRIPRLLVARTGHVATGPEEIELPAVRWPKA